MCLGGGPPVYNAIIARRAPLEVHQNKHFQLGPFECFKARCCLELERCEPYPVILYYFLALAPRAPLTLPLDSPPFRLHQVVAAGAKAKHFFGPTYRTTKR